MPPRITRKSTRPRASDRPMVDTVQPHGLIFVSKLIGVFATNEDAAAEMESPKPNPGAQHQTSVFGGDRGWMSRIFPPSGRRRSIFLDIPFYRSGHTLIDPSLVCSRIPAPPRPIAFPSLRRDAT